MTNWYKIFKYNQSAEGIAQKTYYDIGHDTNQEDALWVYDDGRVEVIYRKDCQDKSICFSHMDQFGGIILSLVYRGRYDGNTKKISLSKPVGMGQFREVPSGLIYKLNQIFPENTGISIFGYASSIKEYKKAQSYNTVEESIDWLKRSGISMEGDKYVFYHGSPKVNNLTELRAGSLLADTEKDARHFAAHNRYLQPEDIVVYKVLVGPEDINTGVFASLNKNYELV